MALHELAEFFAIFVFHVNELHTVSVGVIQIQSFRNTVISKTCEWIICIQQTFKNSCKLFSDRARRQYFTESLASIWLFVPTSAIAHSGS